MNIWIINVNHSRRLRKVIKGWLAGWWNIIVDEDFGFFG
jgi:hypothetical protein